MQGADNGCICEVLRHTVYNTRGLKVDANTICRSRSEKFSQYAAFGWHSNRSVFGCAGSGNLARYLMDPSRSYSIAWPCDFGRTPCYRMYRSWHSSSQQCSLHTRFVRISFPFAHNQFGNAIQLASWLSAAPLVVLRVVCMAHA